MCGMFTGGRPLDGPPQGSQGGETGQLLNSDVFATRASVYLTGGPGAGVASQSYFKLKQGPGLCTLLSTSDWIGRNHNLEELDFSQWQ